MALNLLTYLREQFPPTVIDQISRQLNEFPEQTGRAVDGAVPTVLGALAQRVGQGGVSGVLDLLKNGNYSLQSTPSDISQVSGSTLDTQTAAGAGSNFITQVLGDNTQAAADRIAAYSGIQPSSALVIMDLIGASLTGILGRQAQEQGLSAFNLSSLMAGQVPYIREGLPAGLASIESLLGIDRIKTDDRSVEAVQGVDHFENTPVNPNIPKSTEGERVRENNRWFRWILLLVGVLVLGLAIQKCREPQDSTSGVYTDTTRRAEPDAVEDTSAATKRRVEDANGQVYDSTGSGPLGTRDSSDR